MSNFKELELIDSQSKNILKSQIESYRILKKTINILYFIDVFFIIICVSLNIFINNWNKYSVLILSLSLLSFFFSEISILIGNRISGIYIGFNEDQFEKLANNDYEDVLIYSI